jgi:metal-sulfur cluster biosynthetic enzyme
LLLDITSEMAENGRDGVLLIGPHTTVRDAVSRYPGIEAVFDKYGLGGCGGPGGPPEPIGFFARVHQVDPPALLRELNEFASRREEAVDLPVVEKRPERKRELYFVALAISLLLAVLAGFPLGIVAALGGAGDIGLGARWTPLIQAHGHLQVIGFAGLFIAGVAFHVLPRFKQTELRLPWLALPAIGLIASGVVLRSAVQPWAGASPFSEALVLSGALELAGAGAFAAVVWATLRPVSRKTYDWYILAATGWLVAASAANVVVLADLRGSGAAVIPAAQNGPLLAMQIFGFLTLFILGVSLRVLPHFLSLRPPAVRPMLPALALYNLGLISLTGSGWLEAYGGAAMPAPVTTAGVYLIAAGVLLFALSLKIYLPATAPDEAAGAPKAHIPLIRAAYVWLAAAIGIEVWLATSTGVFGAGDPAFLQAGAARHALALGFITQMIFGVGARALPVFAGKQLHSPRLMLVIFVLINSAAAMRAGSATLEWGSVAGRYDHIAASGALGLAAVTLFGYNIMRTVLAPRPRPARAEDGMQQKTFVLSESSIVAGVLTNVPGSLELLIRYGFKPLADPEMRARVTPHVTLGMACAMHAIDPAALISDLKRLQAGDTAPQREVSAEQRIMNALRNCTDPEIPVNIVDLGLVYEVDADGGRARVKLGLTSPDCPAAPQLLAEVTQTLKELGFEDVKVELVQDPPWQASRMSPAARMALGRQ